MHSLDASASCFWLFGETRNEEDQSALGRSELLVPWQGVVRRLCDGEVALCVVDCRDLDCFDVSNINLRSVSHYVALNTA